MVRITWIRESTDAIFEEVLAQCKPRTIVRIMTIPNGFSGWCWEEIGWCWEEGQDLELSPGDIITLFNEQIIQSADEHNIPVARVDIAFNGTAGDEFPEDKGYLLGRVMSPQGADAIADLLRDLGYEPTIP